MTLTMRERAALSLVAEKSGGLQSEWRVTREPEPDVWYDFADPETRRVGQCRKNADGTWHQAPIGTKPVVLAFLG